MMSMPSTSAHMFTPKSFAPVAPSAAAVALSQLGNQHIVNNMLLQNALLSNLPALHQPKTTQSATINNVALSGFKGISPSTLALLNIGSVGGLQTTPTWNNTIYPFVALSSSLPSQFTLPPKVARDTKVANKKALKSITRREKKRIHEQGRRKNMGKLFNKLGRALETVATKDPTLVQLPSSTIQMLESAVSILKTKRKSIDGENTTLHSPANKVAKVAKTNTIAEHKRDALETSKHSTPARTGSSMSTSWSTGTFSTSSKDALVKVKSEGLTAIVAPSSPIPTAPGNIAPCSSPRTKK